LIEAFALVHENICIVAELPFDQYVLLLLLVKHFDLFDASKALNRNALHTPIHTSGSAATYFSMRIDHTYCDIKRRHRRIVVLEPSARTTIQWNALFDVRVVVATIGTACVYHDSDQLVLVVLGWVDGTVVRHMRRFGFGLCSRHTLDRVRFHVDLHREADSVVELLVAHHQQIELEALEMHGQQRRQLTDAAALESLATSAATVAVVLVVAAQKLAFDVQLERFGQVLLVLDLDADGIERLIAYRDVFALLGDQLIGIHASKQLAQ
jgi:hypothetical protein